MLDKEIQSDKKIPQATKLNQRRNQNEMKLADINNYIDGRTNTDQSRTDDTDNNNNRQINSVPLQE